MCLESISRIAFPEYLASFLDDILREVPAVAISVHTHLETRSALIPTCTTRSILTAWIRRITRPHSGQALLPRPPLSSCLVTYQQRERLQAVYVVYAQLQMRHQMLRCPSISD